MAIQKIIDIQKVGRFEKLDTKAVGTPFTKVVLIYGENGWGKSTIADILRSLSTNKPEIVKGRETLSATGPQKIILLTEGSQTNFDGTRWNGPRPQIAVFDQTFINENVYSGDSVSLDHLKRQYGLVIGARGVELVNQMLEIDRDLKSINDAIKIKEKSFEAIARTVGLPTMNAADFAALVPLEENSPLIAEKELEIRRANLATQINSALLPELLSIPTEGHIFQNLLTQNIEGISEDAYTLLRSHIQSHHSETQISVSHESWLESGMAFNITEDCPFCGQHLDDKQLINAYQGYFGVAYKALAEQILQKRATLGRYISGDFRTSISARIRSNSSAFTNWQNLAGVAPPEISDIESAISGLEEIAGGLDQVFSSKQADMITSIQEQDFQDLLSRWDAHRNAISGYNQGLSDYIARLNQIKNTANQPNTQVLQRELCMLKARQQRASTEVLSDISERQTLLDSKNALTRSKSEMKQELTDHTNRVSSVLGTTINTYLKRLGAGFRINYQPPNYRGSEPAADYSILINEIPVSAKANDDVAKPSFKNTLSTGDKSVLALAIFLATLQAEDGLSDKIVVMDDPFTSMDEFRRTFTANEINKLSNSAKQVIVLSHKKSFLRLLWDRVDRRIITSVAIQTGAIGMASLIPFSLEDATRPRQETERGKVLQFLDATVGEPSEIRRLLRTVLEHFYRSGDVVTFGASDTLDEIIRKIRSQDDDYRYKQALTDLEEINSYTRNFHHAPVGGSVIEDTNIEELRIYCERVRDLTRGFV